jgi:hypothetical protein
MVGGLIPVMLGVCVLAGGDGVIAPGSHLYQPAYQIDDVLRLPAEPYAAQPGDIFLATDRALWARAGHRLAGSGAPHHSGIVFARPDGQMAILEAGPYNSVVVEVIDLLDHLSTHERRGEKVWIRRRKTPLTPEQCARLTEWALAQEGKPFATVRLLAQITPFRTRGPLRTFFCGGPQGERDKFFCSELVVETLVHLGLVDPATARPSATYPRELFFDHSPNPYINAHQDLSACWYPPARWTSCPVTAPVP